MATRCAALAILLAVLTLPGARGQNLRETARSSEPPARPDFVLIRPTPAYTARLKTARASYDDYFWNELQKKVASVFGNQIRRAVLDSIDHSTNPPFVPFALGREKPYKSLVESEASSYYNIVMLYFFESGIFNPRAAPYTDVLEYMWHHQGVMAGLQRFDLEEVFRRWRPLFRIQAPAA